jgi:hypothetical protein
VADDPTAPVAAEGLREQHDPGGPACRAEKVWPQGTVTHICDSQPHQGDMHRCGCGCIWTGPPPAAQGLRERLEQAELASEVVRAPDGNVSVITHSNRTAADRAITVLAQLLDPGDLPALMAAEMARHTGTDEHADAVCAGCQRGDRAAHLTEVAVRVALRHQAGILAEVERLRAELAGVREQLRLANIDAANTTAELAETEAERDALKAAIERAREMHRRSCLVATNPYPEGTLDGVTCHMCAALAVPESPGDAETEDRP